VVELQGEPVGLQEEGVELVEVVGSSMEVKEVVEFPVEVVEEGAEVEGEEGAEVLKESIPR
jgi:hypothetical protein